MNWYDWNMSYLFWNTQRISEVGIDLHELIRLKRVLYIVLPSNSLSWSGLICMNWYDWNIDFIARIQTVNKLVGIDLHELIRLKRLPVKSGLLILLNGRDWSAWIDTIETQISSYFYCLVEIVGIDLHELIRLKLFISLICKLMFKKSGLICMNWYDWNHLYQMYALIIVAVSGLICMNWYDWNCSKTEHCHNNCNNVGIDLHELIRLKQHEVHHQMFDTQTVGIDLHELIRLKLC